LSNNDCQLLHQMAMMSLQQQTQQHTLLLLYLPITAMQDWMWFWGWQSGGRTLEVGFKWM
jgi:hypothetical protein